MEVTITFTDIEIKALLSYLAHSDNLDACALWDKILEASIKVMPERGN